MGAVHVIKNDRANKTDQPLEDAKTPAFSISGLVAEPP